MANAVISALPQEFSALEQCQVLALLNDAERTVGVYRGDFTAPWLLSPIHAFSWRIRKGEETRYVEGNLTNYYEYQWSTQLYDGSNLIDQKNRWLLQNLQRIAFLARELPGGPKTFLSFKSILWSLNFFVRWMFVQGDVLDPRSHAFTKMTRAHFADLFIDLSKGGTFFALRYPQRFIQAVFPLALNRNPNDEELDQPLNLSINVCSQISQWLMANKYMRMHTRTSSRELTPRPSSIAKLIGIDSDRIRSSPKWQAFLRQFSVSDDGVGGGDRLISQAKCRREMPSQRALTTEEVRDVGVSEKTLHKYFDDLKYIVALHRHLPDVCPNPMAFKPQELRQLIVNVTETSSHTPWIPLPIAMAYTTEALRWVHVYGEDLVSMYLETYRALHAQGLLVSAPMPEKDNPTNADIVAVYKEFAVRRDQYLSLVAIPESLTPIAISGWGCYASSTGKKVYEKLRASPSMTDAIMVLVGAITVVVTMTKPMRESEFRALKRECLLYMDGDGYWLSQDLRKKNVEDVRPEDARPIPTIAARAIQLLRRLTDGIKEIIGNTDPWLRDSLVTLPSFGNFEASVSVMHAVRLTQVLDAFCDYVALPLDEKGRRWYLRIHEMRKSFLITFFWTYRYSNIDAARWIAGHSDASHIYAYIQANFPGEELPALEAEYACQVLREYQEAGTPAGIRDVDALYRTVCEHFSVRDVSWIDGSMLKDWLELQFELQEFEIVPYTIKNPDGGMVTEIAFRISAIKKQRGNCG